MTGSLKFLNENKNKEVVKMEKKKKPDKEKIRKKIEELRKQLPEPQKCSRCPNPLFDTFVSADTEPYKIGKEEVCRECYFKELGDEIEKNPIGNPKRIKVF